MINLKSSSFKELKNEILNYIKSLDNFKQISKELNPSTIDLLVSLIAGYTTYTNFKYTMNKDETFLLSAKQANSIFQIAFTLGYRFQRAKSPILNFKYFGKEDIILRPGDIIGKYNDYEIIYFDYPKKVKSNDIIQFVLGKYYEDEINLINNFNSKIYTTQTFRSIDNDLIFIESENGLEKPSIRFEDFILNNKIVNWSLTNTEMILYINDKENNFGNNNIENLKIKYIETDGKIDFIENNEIKVNNDFVFINLFFNGLNEDSLDKIKKIAPNLRNTKARAVTLDDYYYYIMNTNLFDDVYVEPEQNIPANWKLNFNENENIFAINIEGSYIELEKYDYETIDDFKLRFFNALEKNELIHPKLIKKIDNTGYDLYLEQKYLEREISIKAKNIGIEKLNDFVKAQSCVLNVYYVKKGKEPLRKPLTTSELIYLDNYIKNYSIVGIKLVYIPALPKVTTLNLAIKLVDNRFKDEVYNYIKQLIEKYQYKVNTQFNIDELISELVKFKTYLNDIEIYPIQYVKNLSDEKFINTEKYEYIVFYGIDISFIEG